MKAYQFIFLIGFLNTTIPFLGIPYLYKNYVLIGLAVVTLAYALILRAVEYERKIIREQKIEASKKTEKTIEQVVEMEEKAIVSDLKTKRKKAVAIKRVFE